MPVTFELGGKSPNIVFDDADFEGLIIGAISGILRLRTKHVLLAQDCAWFRKHSR